MYDRISDVPEDIWEDTEYRASVQGERFGKVRPLCVGNGEFITELEDEWPLFETILGDQDYDTYD